MNKVYACIDGRANTPAVTDAAAWSARRLSLPLVLAHVVEPQVSLSLGTDANGAIGLGAPDVLLQQLSELVAQRSQIEYSAQAASNQALDLLGATRLFAACGFAV